MKRLKKSFIVILTIVFICMTGCDSDEKDVCKAEVEEFLTAYQSLDGDANQYLANKIEKIEYNGIQGLLAEQITFSVNNVKKYEDDSYIVTTQITNVDFKEAFETVTEDVNEETPVEVIIEKLYEIVKSDSAPHRDFTIEIKLNKYGNEYKIELTEELSNALFGGYNEYLSELIGEMNYE